MVNLSEIFVVTCPLFGREWPSLSCTKLKNLNKYLLQFKGFQSVENTHTNNQNIVIFTYCDQKNILYEFCWFSLTLIFSTVVLNSTFKYFFALWRIFGCWDIQILNISVNWVTNIYVDVLLFPCFSISAGLFIKFSGV